MVAMLSPADERQQMSLRAVETGRGRRVWGAGGLFCVVFFAGGILAAGEFPRADVPMDGLTDYLSAHRAGLRALSACHVVAALMLLLFAARVLDAVAGQGEGGWGGIVGLGFGGAVLAVGSLGASALLFWTLASPDLTGEPGVLRAVHLLSFLTGGVGLLAGLGFFAGCAGLVGLQTHGLPSWLAAMGIAVAAVDLASPFTLLAHFGPLGPDGLVPVAGAVLSLLWIALTSTALILRPRSGGG
ncbi:MAG: hypothetical protein M3N47_02580 [Chloroflexota bacterium]|nr:hypothetical protein [Chloroflexota bacterium]